MSDEFGAVNLQKLKVADLKKMLKEKGLSSTGNKSELVQKLRDAGMETPDEGDITGDISLGEGDIDTTAEEEELAERFLTEEDNDGDKDKENNADVLDMDTKIELDEEIKKVEPTKPKITHIQMGDEKTISAPSTIEPISAPESKHPVITGPPTDEDKATKRAERFGIQSDDTKKKSRAERFGLPVGEKTSPTTTKAAGDSTPKVITPSALSPDDVDKMKKRAERFGTVTSTSLSKVEDTDKLKKRAERFGSITSTTLAKTDMDEKLLKRKERFGSGITSADESEKKKSRAERFGLAGKEKVTS